MTWLQLLAQAAVFATFLGVFVAVVAYISGKHIKEGVLETERLLVQMRSESREMAERMQQSLERYG